MLRVFRFLGYLTPKKNTKQQTAPILHTGDCQWVLTAPNPEQQKIRCVLRPVHVLQWPTGIAHYSGELQGIKLQAALNTARVPALCLPDVSATHTGGPHSPVCLAVLILNNSVTQCFCVLCLPAGCSLPRIPCVYATMGGWVGG